MNIDFVYASKFHKVVLKNTCIHINSCYFDITRSQHAYKSNNILKLFSNVQHVSDYYCTDKKIIKMISKLSSWFYLTKIDIFHGKLLWDYIQENWKIKLNVRNKTAFFFIKVRHMRIIMSLLFFKTNLTRPFWDVEFHQHTFNKKVLRKIWISTSVFDSIFYSAKI